MTDQRKKLGEILHQFEEMKEPYSELEVSEKLRKLWKELNESGDQPSEQMIAESMAFDFMEDSSDPTGWGTYFGPIGVLKNDQGQWIETPSIKLVTPEILQYWQDRTKVVKNPILKARYADLVWDFSKPVKGSMADVSMARISIDSYLEIIANELYKHEVRAITKLKRSLDIALSINDRKKIELARDAIIRFEDKIAQDNLPGLWGFSYDLLIENKRVPLDDDQKSKIINDLVKRFNRLCGVGEGSSLSVLSAERAAMRLIKYYRRINQPEEVKRILKIYGQAYVRASESVSSLVGLMWIKKIYDLYIANGMKEDANELNTLLRKLGQKTHGEMKLVSTTVEIPTNKLDDYISSLTGGPLLEALRKIAIHFLPDLEKVEGQVQDLAKKSPFQAFIPECIIDHEGRIVAQIGSVEEDLEGRVVMQMTQNINFESIFLRKVIKETLSKFNPSPQELLDYFYTSPIFDPDKKELIKNGLEAYYQGDHVSAAHILIPQIEDTLRNLLKITNRPLDRPNKIGGNDLRILYDILRDEMVEVVLTDRIVKYLIVVLVDPRGLNLRNLVCHGLMPADGFGEQMTDRLFHILLLLTLVNKKQPVKGME